MQCPVCNNVQFSNRKLIPEVSIATCTQCGFQISDIKRADPAGLDSALINDEQYQRSVGTLRQHQATEILQFVGTYAKPGDTWLDVGCRFGYQLVAARRSGFKVYGVEPDEDAMKRARAALGDDCIHFGLMDDAARPDASADIISMLDVLEHIPANALPEFARMIQRKLTPGGHWLLKVPCTEGLYYIFAHTLLPYTGSLLSGIIKRLWQSEYEYPHTVYFNHKTLSLFLENHGYEVVATKYLEEVPSSTVMDRLMMDSTITRWQAVLIAPAFYFINAIEKFRRKSDALLVLARPRVVQPARQ